ncbi:DUF1120 domain-containing protein [Erwinia sp. Eh17-17]|uniref:DUF1120 domain-containing protein n=1 Tax=Erwinia sp. Eh17-17 TaxID=3080330 RepID=UPI0032086973
MKKTVIALLLAASATSAFAADSVDVRVIGTIVPAACVPTLPGGTVVDYGTIKADSISKTAYTVLPEKMIDFTIQCDAPAKVAIRAINGRKGSLAGVTENAEGGAVSPVALFGSAGTVAVGLGKQGASKVGGYGIRIIGATATADGVPVSTLVKPVTGTSWAISAAGGMLYDATWSRVVSWGAAGSKVPVAFTVFSGQLSVQAYINKGSALDLTQPVHLDGLSTLEMYYL